jgi:hypothetical protein
MLKRTVSLPALVMVALLATWTPSANADAVTDWNEIAVKAAAAGRPGPPGLLDLAIVHAAAHDAAQAIERRFEPYAYSDPSRTGIGSVDAAVAAAAHRALVRIYPAQQKDLDPIYDAYLASHGLAGDPALATGTAAADLVYEKHYRPVTSVEPFYGRNTVGQWRSAAPMAAVYLASTQPFTLEEAAQFRPAPPPPLTSGRYLRDFEEVRRVGSVAAHPSSGTEIARFWSAEFASQWNEALRDVANRHVPDTADRARLFALANLSAADALIAVWDCKIHYNLWRPSTAIAEADNDGNRYTQGDGLWTGLIADPPYPDYVSGANGLTGAFTRSLQLFFGTDDLAFTVKTTNGAVSNKVRHYERISDAAQEVVDARIFLGIHFRTADEEGRRLGTRVAQWAHANYLRPVQPPALIAPSAEGPCLPIEF